MSLNRLNRLDNLSQFVEVLKEFKMYTDTEIYLLTAAFSVAAMFAIIGLVFGGMFVFERVRRPIGKFLGYICEKLGNKIRHLV